MSVHVQCYSSSDHYHFGCMLLQCTELNNSTGSKTFAKERAMKLKGYLNFRWL